VNENDRLWGDEGDSTLPSPSLLDRGAESVHLSLPLLALGWLLAAMLLLRDLESRLSIDNFVTNHPLPYGKTDGRQVAWVWIHGWLRPLSERLLIRRRDPCGRASRRRDSPLHTGHRRISVSDAASSGAVR
ncbi:hypothetical protein LDENG_00127950, partial [Lucifuga dentata]